MTPEMTFTVMWVGDGNPGYTLRTRIQHLERQLTAEKFRDLPALMRRVEEYVQQADEENRQFEEEQRQRIEESKKHPQPQVLVGTLLDRIRKASKPG